MAGRRAEWVVRAGICSASSLIKGYSQHGSVPGLFGFSVQYASGETVEGLAQAGKFPHSMISYATYSALSAALQPLGYTMRLIKSPGMGYHHTFAVLYDASSTPLRVLPNDAASALSAAFRQRPNPAHAP